ncbi:hypothetical protein [Nocardioides campestrisoli]|uniref:hypothetical protein n=1 Tax=Nocardioides campestrisoli TaxID=2736757 RepID=UPI0015E78DA7|nr:hypothetical protein [Nocardioides campestrisoli]
MAGIGSPDLPCCGMKYDRLWKRLLEFLNDWGTAAVTEPGRITLTFAHPDGSTRTVEIVMSRDEWDEMVTIPFGEFGAAARAVRATALSMEEDEHFLVYEQYALVASSTPDLPVDAEEAHLAELIRQHPEGRWVVLDDEGNVIDEFPPR